jgi:hypothetical protein
MAGYIKAVQVIADDQTEVATKTQQLLDTESIDANEITNLEVTTFGANKFLITILYQSIHELTSFVKSFGLKATAPTKSLSFTRTFSVKAGLVSSFKELTNDVGQIFSSKIGLLLTMPFKLSTKMTTKAGLKATAPTYALLGTRENTTKVGMGVFWVAWLNGVQIELYP